MPEEIMNAVISEEYADFIIDYRYNEQLLQQFSNAVIHIMNNAFAVIYLPVPPLNNLIRDYSYAYIPRLYGLTSQVSLRASGVERLHDIPSFDLYGEGVLIGIVDSGVDYRNSALIKEDGTTKIVSLWDQSIPSTDAYPDDTYFGTEYSAEQINSALASENPLEIVPSIDTNGHGTMMAGVAVGNTNDEAGFAGVAPQSELVVVKLRQAKQYLRDFFLIPENVVCYQENHIMWGVQYCIQVARRLNRPIAICLGLGTSQTSHVGQTNLSSFLSILGDFRDVGIAIAVGNEGNLGRHFYAAVRPEAGSSLVELNVGENEGSFSMELWGIAPGIYSVDVMSPGGEYIPNITASLRLTREISFIFERTILNIDYQLMETASGNQLILFRFLNPSQGIWRFNVYVRSDLLSAFHIWLPMGDFITDTTYFIQANIYTTVLAPSTSLAPIGITAYNPASGGLYPYASRGFTVDNFIKPELAAPGVDYIAPALDGSYVPYTGTGVAAAHTAGIIALFLEWAVIRQQMIGIDTIAIKNYLIRGAERDQNITYPNRDWGYGKLNIFDTFNILTED